MKEMPDTNLSPTKQQEMDKAVIIEKAITSENQAQSMISAARGAGEYFLKLGAGIEAARIH